MRPELPPRTTPDPGRRTARTADRGARRLLPFLLITAVAVAIAAREIPAVGALLQRWFQPDAWQAAQTCQVAALGLAVRPESARLVAPGTVHATQGGFYVEALTIGEMAAAGGETRFHVACYTDAAGRLVRADRIGGARNDSLRENPP